MKVTHKGPEHPSWQIVWGAAARKLSTPGLEALRKALADDDARLIQGATTDPPPLPCTADWGVDGACLLGLCGWQGDGLKTVGEVGEYFIRLCCDIDEDCGGPAACRCLLNWYDETPREEVRRLLLPEVEKELASRSTALKPA